MTRRSLLATGDALFLDRHRALFDALARRTTDVAVLPLDRGALRVPFARFIAREALAGRVRPSRAALRLVRDRFEKSAHAFDAKSRWTQRAIAACERRPDVVFAVFSLFTPRPDDQGPPYVHLLDYTMALARERWAPWAPFATDREARAWLARERDTYARAAHLFTMSGIVRDSLVRDYGIDPARITVVGSGGNVRGMPLAVRTLGSRRIVFNGSEFERKGGDLVLDAFARVRAALPDATLVIVGTTDVPSADGVDVRGRIADRSALAQLLTESDIVVAPARCDPFPGFVIEAMHYGAVPIVSDADGMPEIVGHAGIVLRPPTAATLAGALIDVLADPVALERRSRAARDRVAHSLNWDAVAMRIEETLARLSSGYDEL